MSLIFPRGRAYSAPATGSGGKVAELVTRAGASRERLCQYIYWTLEPGNPLGLLQEALLLAQTLEPLEKRIRVEGVKTGRVTALDFPARSPGTAARNHLRDGSRIAAGIRPQSDEPRARGRLRTARAGGARTGQTGLPAGGDGTGERHQDHRPGGVSTP